MIIEKGSNVVFCSPARAEMAKDLITSFIEPTFKTTGVQLVEDSMWIGDDVIYYIDKDKEVITFYVEEDEKTRDKIQSPVGIEA